MDSGHVRNRRDRQEAAGAPSAGGDGERQDGEGTEDGADGHAFFAEAPQDGASDGESLTPRDEALVGRVAAGKSDYWDAELFEYIASDLLKAVRTVFAHTSGTVEAAVEYDVRTTYIRRPSNKTCSTSPRPRRSPRCRS